MKIPNSYSAFARLRHIFSCKAYGRVWDLALVTLFTTTHAPDTSITGMRRLKEAKRSCFIRAAWIERSVLLSRDYEFNKEASFFANDLTDKDNASDIFLRLQKLDNVQ